MNRQEIREAPRSQLRVFLESWGYAVYSDDKLEDLRECAMGHTDNGSGPMVKHYGWTPGKGFVE